MSFCDQMAAAIDGARTLTRLDHLSRSIWQGLAAGAVADDDAQALAERLHARRSVLRGEIKPVGIPVGRPSIFPPRRLQRAPKRPVAIARRRHLAASGPMPPALACKFTVSELAVLRIIGDEVRQHGQLRSVRGRARGPGWGVSPDGSERDPGGSPAWACDGRGASSRRPPQPAERRPDRLEGVDESGWRGEGGRAVRRPRRR